MKLSTEPTRHRTSVGDQAMLRGLRSGLRILMGEQPDLRQAQLDLRRELLLDSHGYPWLPTNKAIRRRDDQGDGSYTARTPMPLRPRAN